MHIDICENAENDLDQLWQSDPEAAATITAVLEQMEADPNIIDVLTTRGNSNLDTTRLNIKVWENMRNQGNLWRFRILDTPATNYRVVYGYHWQTRQICILAIVHKENFDYDDTNSVLSRRIVADWRAL